VLWPTDVPKEKALILCSDGVAYVLKTATPLKVFYPNLIHFTCLAHGMQPVAKEVRAKFPQVSKLISVTKEMFLKAPCRVQSCKQHSPDAPCPPEPVQTRQGTWTEAVNFYG
jgi:hypothetical protein